MKKKTVGTGITQRESVSFDLTTKEGQAESWDHLYKFFDQDFSSEGLYLRRIEKLARQILEKSGLATPDADLIGLANLPVGDSNLDSAEGYAVRFLQELRLIRAVVSRGERAEEDIVRRSFFDLGALYTEARMKFKWEPPALRGLEFIEGPKRPRLDALGRLILDTMRDLEGELRRRPKAKEIWASLPIGDVVQELDGYDTIYWRSNGREKKTIFGSFENRVTLIRKKILS